MDRAANIYINIYLLKGTVREHSWHLVVRLQKAGKYSTLHSRIRGLQLVIDILYRYIVCYYYNKLL